MMRLMFGGAHGGPGSADVERCLGLAFEPSGNATHHRHPSAQHGYGDDDALEHPYIRMRLLAPCRPASMSGSGPTQNETSTESTDHHQRRAKLGSDLIL